MRHALLLALAARGVRAGPEHVFDLREDGTVTHAFNGSLTRVPQHAENNETERRRELEQHMAHTRQMLSQLAGDRRARPFDMFELMQREVEARRAAQRR